VEGLKCWKCNKCSEDKTSPTKLTGKLVDCANPNDTCWLYIYSHGNGSPNETKPHYKTTNYHRLCDTRSKDPPIGKRCKYVSSNGLRGFHCQCNTDRCNINQNHFVRIISMSPPTLQPSPILIIPLTPLFLLFLFYSCWNKMESKCWTKVLLTIEQLMTIIPLLQI